MKRQDYINMLILVIFTLTLIFFCVPNNSLFGSSVDWINQHSVFPEYFRDLFQQTHSLFPDFASQLGGGQNIYNFSYYGLFSPMVLLSYIFYNIPMPIFVSTIMICFLLLDVIFIYIFLRQRSKNRIACMVGSICFITSTSLFFQSHRQIMFVNYMPFLLLSLISLPNLIDKNKKHLFIISIVFIILSSYYYAIAALMVIVLYACFLLYKRDHNFNQLISKDAMRVILCIIVAILLCAFMLLPTAYAMMNGRGIITHPFHIEEILKIDLSFKSVLYDHYTLGLTSISLLALIWQFYTKRRSNQVLSGIVMIIVLLPLCWWMLNGFLYARTKILIPLLPLFAYFIMIFINDAKLIWKHRNYQLTILLFILIIVITVNNKILPFLLIDLAITLFAVYLNTKEKLKFMSLIIIISIPITNIFITNKSENYVNKQDLDEIHHFDKLSLIKSVDNSQMYRFEDFSQNVSTSNQVYDLSMWKTSQYSSINNPVFNQFFYETMGNAMGARNRITTTTSSHVIYQQLMGTKYVISKYDLPYNYKQITQRGKYILGENVNPLPLMYASYNLMDQNTFNSLPWNQKLEMISNHSIVKQTKKQQVFESTSKPIDYTFQDLGKISNIEEIENGIKLKVKKSTTFKWELKEEINDQAILVSFDLTPLKAHNLQDFEVVINGVKNKLSSTSSIYQNKNNRFHFVLSSNEPIKELIVKSSKGEYTFTNILIQSIDLNKMNDFTSSIDPLIYLDSYSSLEHIKGDIQVKEDGYFITSIPYQKGFEIKVDGKKQKYEKVNEAFIGFAIKQGDHTVEISYDAPFKQVGICISGFTLMIYIVYCVMERKRKYEE